MTNAPLLARRATTPTQALPDFSGAQSLPGDLMLMTCRRVGAVGMVAAGLWTFSLVTNGVFARSMGRVAIIKELWPYPALPVALIGLAISLLMVRLASRLQRWPERLVLANGGFLIVSCFLVALVGQWVPPAVSPRISWLCILILTSAAIAPASTRQTLTVSLVAASMEPLAFGITWLRGVPVDTSPLYLTWSFLPTYLCALIAVVPSRIIGGLGQQVRRARELGSYRLEELLGKGGMGEVYRATHQMLARPAAVKIIRAEVLKRSSSDHAKVMMQRFRREAEASAALRSPHTIDLYDFGVAQDGTFFLVMELLEGLDLQSLVDRYGPLPADRVAHLVAQAAASLDEAHSRGLIHRDIKPSNIFISRMGLEVDFVKVLDFGLVKALDDPQSTLLTAPDVTTGTPAFIAPEVARGEADVDHRVDIYALGCVAYWLLTGRLVFEARNALHLLQQHANAAPTAPSERIELPIPPGVDEVILACLAKDPEDRPASAGELGRRLLAAAGEHWTQERAQQWWARHRPEIPAEQPTRIADLTLDKAVDSGWSE